MSRPKWHPTPNPEEEGAHLHVFEGWELYLETITIGVFRRRAHADQRWQPYYKITSKPRVLAGIPRANLESAKIHALNGAAKIVRADTWRLRSFTSRARRRGGRG